jgi:hypothetical protein
MDYLCDSARKIADVSSVADIELHSVDVMVDGQQWWDTRVMLDPREHCPDVIEMSTWVLDYATARGLAVRHHEQPHLVRIVRDVMPAALETM